MGLAVAWANSELMKNIAEIGNVRLQHVARDAGDESDPVASKKFSVKPTLTGQRVILRPFRDEDFGAMKAAVSDPEVQRLTGAAHSATSETPSEDVTRRWYATRNAQNDRLDLAVVDKATGETVGEVVLNEWDAANNSCSFRTLIGPRERGRGLGTEAIRLVIGYGFEQLGMHRISLEVYAFNPRARHVYEKVGFVEEGVLREALRYEDEWVDASVMSILASEWEQHRGRPEEGRGWRAFPPRT